MAGCRWKILRWSIYCIGLFGCNVGGLTTQSLAEPAHANAATPFAMPVPFACVSSPFGARHLANSPLPNAFHNGIDLPASVGTPVLAVGPGTVMRVQRKGPGGLEVLIQHNGFIGIYSHLGLVAPSIAEGYRTITAGEKIGTIGRSGLTFGPHLFFGMIVGKQAVDPAPILGVVPCAARSASTSHAASTAGRRSPTRVY
jgi:murein DD-endopeptidase MepM/ murein hydrolase activator NlpD